MPDPPARIYHVVPLPAFRRHRSGARYAPPSLASEGFVHCTATPSTLLQVAADYFGAETAPLLLLEIAPGALAAPLRFEAPAPAAGAGRAHLASGERFPHLYGPLELDAVCGAALLERAGGRLVWPDRWEALDALLGWRVVRCDDHGNEFEVEADLDETSARARAAALEARGHKQSYRAARRAARPSEEIRR